jgi:hypothetical protein
LFWRNTAENAPNSNLTFTGLLQALHGNKAKFALQKWKNRPPFRKAPRQFHAKNGQP